MKILKAFKIQEIPLVDLTKNPISFNITNFACNYLKFLCKGLLYLISDKRPSTLDFQNMAKYLKHYPACLLYTSPSPRDLSTSRMPSSA